MIDSKKFERALGITYGGYGHVINIKGYKPIHYQHEIFTERGKAITFEEYQYTWGGQAITEERFRIYLDEFADGLTDEQIVERFIELVKDKNILEEIK